MTRDLKLSLIAISSVLFSAFLFSAPVLATEAKPAIDACTGKAKDDACSFTSRKGKAVEGTCMARPKADKSLVCVPKRLKEAKEACDGKAVGDSCSVTTRKGTKEGTCEKGLRGHMRCKLGKAAASEPASAPVKPAGN